MHRDSERAPPGGTARAGTAATGTLDNSERAPPGVAAAIRAAAAATGCSMTESARRPAARVGAGLRRLVRSSVRRPAAQPRPGWRQWGCLMTASRRHPVQGSRAQRPARLSRKGGATVGSWVASRAPGVERRRCRAGTAAGEEVVAGVTTRPPLRRVRQSATSGHGGWGRGGMIYGGG